jgi:hypothetical protein
LRRQANHHLPPLELVLSAPLLVYFRPHKHYHTDDGREHQPENRRASARIQSIQSDAGAAGGGGGGDGGGAGGDGGDGDIAGGAGDDNADNDEEGGSDSNNIIGDEEAWVDILKEQYDGAELQYLISWENCDESENSWEPVDGIDAPSILAAFHSSSQYVPAKKRAQKRKRAQNALRKKRH